MVEQAGGVPVLCKSGHAFIKEKMRAEDAVYGGEMSAHHYFREFAYADSGMIPWLLIAQLVSESGRSLADWVEDRMPQRSTRNLRRAVARAGHTDGVSADFGDWRFNLRSSNTESRNVESRGDAALMQARTDEISSLLQK